MSRKMKIIAIGVVTTVVLAVIIAIVSVHVANAAGYGSYEAFQRVDAICVINGGPKNRVISGTLRLSQESSEGPVSVNGAINGFPPNTDHGFHVHNYGDFSNEENSCLSAGSHFNPENHSHGGPTNAASDRHVGDLGNINADSSGIASVGIIDSVISMTPGSPNNIIGRAIVVHEKKDDLGTDGLDSKNTGNAGSRLGCCIIGIAPPPKSP